MNALDVSIALALMAAVVGGWRRGLVARVCTGVGAVAGLLLVAANLPWVVTRLPFGDQRPGFVSVLTALVMGALGGRLVGMLFGRWLRRRLPGRPLRQADRTGGAVLGGAGVAAVVWLAAPLFALVPGWPAAQWSGSQTSSLVTKRFPPPPDALGSLRFLLADASFPRVLDTLTNVRSSVRAPAQLTISESVLQQAAASTVTIRSRACGRVSSGTGTIVGSRLVVTNAHVVAGATKVDVDDGSTVRVGTVVSADALHDLALIRVETALPANPLRVVAGTDPATAAAAIGRGSGVARPIAVSLDQVLEATGRDIYDRSTVDRAVMVLAGRLQPGDSGGPVVDAQGRLLGLMFARAADKQGTGFAVGADAIRALIDRPPTPDAAARCLG